MQTGRVKFFNEEKGFGFITNTTTNQDIFVHVSGLSDKNVQEGDLVSYLEGEGKKGKIATDVKLIEE